MYTYIKIKNNVYLIYLMQFASHCHLLPFIFCLAYHHKFFLLGPCILKKKKFFWLLQKLIIYSLMSHEFPITRF